MVNSFIVRGQLQWLRQGLVRVNSCRHPYHHFLILWHLNSIQHYLFLKFFHVQLTTSTMYILIISLNLFYTTSVSTISTLDSRLSRVNQLSSASHPRSIKFLAIDNHTNFIILNTNCHLKFSFPNIQPCLYLLIPQSRYFPSYIASVLLFSTCKQKSMILSIGACQSTSINAWT